MLSGAPSFCVFSPPYAVTDQLNIYTGEKMKIVVWKSPKYLSKILAKLLGTEDKEEKK